MMPTSHKKVNGNTSEGRELRAARIQKIETMRNENPFLTATAISRRMSEGADYISPGTVSSYMKQADTEMFKDGFDRKSIFVSQVRGLQETISQAFEESRHDLVIKANQRLSAMLNLDGYEESSDKAAVNAFLEKMNEALNIIQGDE